LRTASIPRARRASSTAPSPSCRSGCAETSIETLAYGYDAAGNLISRAAGKTTQLALSYNADGRPAGAATESYKYDGFGERALINATATSHDIFGRSGELLAENTATGTPLRSYVYLNGLPLALVDSAGNIDYILADQVGQPQKMVDGSATLVWDRVADEFGATVAQPVGMTAALPLRFPGQQYDAATGLHYNRFRDYDSALGRYIQSDPIGLAGGVNTYAYALNRPTGVIDPNGLWGFGADAGGSIEGGAVAIGAGATVSGGAGVFWGGSQGVNFGAFGSAGAFAGGPGYGVQYPAYPKCENVTVAGGAYAGAGAGVFLTNARSAGELRGPFNTHSFNVGVGPIRASLQIGVSGKTWIGSLTFGPGVGISGSSYPTNTWATGP
jgi:RHS repeat-associated protein